MVRIPESIGKVAIGTDAHGWHLNVRFLIPHNCFNSAGRKALCFLLLTGLRCY